MEVSICSSICSQEDNVNLYFVKLDEDSPSNILLCAYQACEKFNRQWLSLGDCKQVTPTKEDVFICDPFEGEAFEYLVSCPKSIVVGPRCILSCLHRMEPIPALPSPLHNTAMSGIVITTTGFPKPQKEKLQHLVQQMSGIYSNSYHQDVTHLVVKMVGSEKYKVAVEQGCPTMTEEWVTAVWEAVLTGDVSSHVSASDNRFLPYLCKPLHGLIVCVSQADQSTKLSLKKLIEENGGTYTTKLAMGETSVLIVSSPEGKKYRFAIKWGVPCVFPDWLHNSVQQGHALDKEEYEVLPRKSSTFNSILGNEMPPDLSMCSTILNDTDTQRTISSVDETVSLDVLVKERDIQEENSEDVEALENLDLQEAMKAGSFLKGYRVFLSGFNANHMEKLRRVLGAVGASRLSQLTESATHVVLAIPNEEHMRIMQGWNTKPHVVSVRWLTESVHLKHPAEESHFAFLVQACREVQLSQTSSTGTQRSSISSTALGNDETHVDEKLLQEHSQHPRRESSAKESEQDLSLLPESQASELPGIFSGKIFSVFGRNQEMNEELEEMIELHGGHVAEVGSSETIHYSVVTAEDLHNWNKGQLISRAFLEDCVETKRLLAVEYYHLPLLLPGNSFPLEDCCITVSIYSKSERYFLEHISTLLGAQNQQTFSKMSKPDKNILANTHLVCPTPIGAKYNAAKRWCIPAVTCDWLLECARSGKKVPENTFLVDCSDNDTMQLPRKDIIMELWNSAVREGEKRKEVEEEEEEVVPPTPHVAKIKSIQSTEVPMSLSPDRPFNWEAISRKYPTPGTTQFYQAKREEDLDTMPSPDSPYGLTWYSDPPPRIRKCIKKLIDSLPGSPPGLANPTRKSPTKELFSEFFEDLDKCTRKHQQLLEEVLDHRVKMKGKIADKSEEEGNSLLSTSKDTGLGDNDHGMQGEWEDKEEDNTVEVRADERLSYQLEEIARASLVERSGGVAGRNKIPLAELQRPTTPSKMNHIDLESQPSEEVEPLATQITWNDPEEHLARLSLQEHIQKETEDSSAPVQKENDASNNSNDDDSNKENMPSAPWQNKLPPQLSNDKSKERGSCITSTEDPQQPVFLLVGMSAEEVEDYTEIVARLGGAVSLSQTLEAHVTHVVAKMLSRSERTFMSIASGKWVLTTSYLDHSLKAGHFIKEEPYAWGNQSNKHQPKMDTESMQTKLAKAAWRWKCAMSGVGDNQGKQWWQKKQPFQNMTALIHSQRSKSLSRLIEAGGGQVVSARPPYSEVEGVTHFFVEMEKPNEKIDLASFASRGIPCLEPKFISSCIMDDDPETSDFYIPAYKEILINMSSCIPSPLKRAHRN
uniref:BRCT domain-containing protein n=1 Tax=Scylla olivacea TaxID=85551 RepID=A0A0P4VX53_SCYOL